MEPVKVWDSAFFATPVARRTEVLNYFQQTIETKYFKIWYSFHILSAMDLSL